MKHPRRVITEDVVAFLVAEAWPLSFTLANIMSGFKKCSIYLINPGQVTDCQLALSKALRSQQNSAQASHTPSLDSTPSPAPAISSVSTTCMSGSLSSLLSKWLFLNIDIKKGTTLKTLCIFFG